MAKFLLSRSAKDDLVAIADYTILKFGISQARIYKDGLTAIFQKLADNPTIGRPFFSGGNTNYKRFRFKAHTIFFVENEKGILIVRILGSKMDASKYLK